jgi:apolipoprotein N-acyltransferase
MATCFAAGFLMCKRSPEALVLFFASLISMGFLINMANLSTPLEKYGSHRSVKIALVQHNLPFSEEWRIDHPAEVKKKYETLAVEAAKQHPDMIIFPQYTFLEDIYRQPDFFTELAKKTGAYILTGTHVPIEPGKSILDHGYMNLAILFTLEGKLGGVYQAMASAPFGEISQLPAKKYQIIETPFGKLGILLCYEDVTSRIPKEAVKAGAEILVSLSNPGLFVDTSLPYYYLQQDQLRVMETGLPLVRVSPNGYTAFIDRTGSVLQKTKLNKEEILQVECSLK